MEQILFLYGLPKETATAIMVLYKNTIVCTRDGEVDFFDIIAGVLQGDKLAPYLIIIFLGYLLRTSIDLMKENGLTLNRAISRQYHAQTIMDANNADDIALYANTPIQAES